MSLLRTIENLSFPELVTLTVMLGTIIFTVTKKESKNEYFELCPQL